MAIDSSDFRDLLRLEHHGPDTFVAETATYPWGWVYGGQAVAQAQMAAAMTVDDDKRVHSLHAYFIRTGSFDEPIRFDVDRIRNGRSFATRHVVARQSGGAICNVSVSFQREEVDADRQVVQPPPEAPAPDDEHDTCDWTPLINRDEHQVGVRGGISRAWLRMAHDLGDDVTTHQCGLTFLSDDLPTDAVVSNHPAAAGWGDDFGERFFNASLDHAVWFHRPFRADRWLYFDFVSHGLRGARGLATGNVFDTDGVHVATVAQEVLLRQR